MRLIFLAFAMFAASALAKAEQGAIRITPKLEPGKALQLELENSSKLVATVRDLKLSFIPIDRMATCDITVVGSHTLKPGERAIVSVGTAENFRGCTAVVAPHGAGLPQILHPSVDAVTRMPTADFAAARTIRPAELQYKIEIGQRKAIDQVRTINILSH